MCCEWAEMLMTEHRLTRGVEAGEPVPQGRWWLLGSGAVRCRGVTVMGAL